MLLLLACTGSSDTADTAPTSTCQPVEGVYELGDDDTEIHGTSAFDGERLWVSWVRPNDSATFDVMLAAVDCAGQLVVEPRAVTDSADNEIDPSLAVSGDRLLVVWTASTDAGLSLRTRAYDLEGEPVDAVQPFEGTRKGMTVTGNATTARVRGVDGGFVLAGSWGHDDADAFQAFWVELDLDGLPIGEATDAELDTENGQTAVDLVVDPVVVAWQEDSTTSTEPTAVWSDSGVLATPGARPSLAWHDDALWAAWDTNDGTVELRPPSGEVVALDLPGFAHSPRLAGGQLLTMSVDNGVYNALHLHSVDETGVVSTLDLPTTTAPSVYGVDVTPMGSGHVAVVWADGENPDFQLKVGIYPVD